MAASVTIELQDAATPLATRLALEMQPERLAHAAAPAVVNRLRKHFFGLNRERPNKLGGKRTNFWNQAARSTHSKVTGTDLVVSVNQVGVRQRLEGGEIRPASGRRYLTIPAIAEAYATRAGEWSTVKFGFAFDEQGRIRPALIEAQHTAVKFGGKRKDGSRKLTATVRQGGGAVFWLVRRVTQRPDPTVLPSNEELREAAFDGVRRFFNLVVRRGGQA
ncbi:MAG: hypothetical protein KIT22_07890 [Verrucomicrobiae bacterium]|nr:hypothetical protein [Verrucomicrobiae bacterium]